jgi:Protein of unknown function (DUF3108)
MRFLLRAGAFLAAAFASTAGDLPSAATEKLTYQVEWRLIHAGDVTVESGPDFTKMDLESAGLVSKLYRVQDIYSVKYDDPFCATSAVLEGWERKRHHQSTVTYDRRLNRAFFVERDLANNSVVWDKNIEIPNCVHDAIGALRLLRQTDLRVGKSIEFPVSDGKKSASVKIEAQKREKLTTGAGTFETVRYEAGLLNGVVYSRKGRLLVWLSDDERKLPVRIQLKMNFPLGTVTLDLQKEQRL